MVRFIRILKNYENMGIIKHKVVIAKSDIKFRNQEISIQEFSDAIKKAEKEWFLYLFK